MDEQVLIELITKVMYMRGNLSLVEVARHLHLPPMILEDMFDFLRAERVVELKQIDSVRPVSSGAG